MKLSEVANQPQSLVEAIKKAFETALDVRGARLDEIIELGIDAVAFTVEYDFPEHLVKGADIKKAGAPHITKVAVVKGDLWREGVYGAQFEITLKTPIETAEAAKLLAELKKEYKIK